jgi:O-antigen/teichoic acid export membrane protein
MSVKKRIIRNTTFSALAHGISSIITFLLLPYLIHRLGAAEYGLFGFARTFSFTGMMALSDAGLRKSIVKYVAQYEAQGQAEDLRTTITSSALFLLAAGMILAALGALVSGGLSELLAVPEEARGVFGVALTIVFVSYAFELPGAAMAGALEGLQRYDYLKLVEIARVSLYAGLAIYFVSKGAGFLSLVGAYTVASLLQTLTWSVLTFRALRDRGRGAKIFSVDSLRQCLGMGKYLFSAQVSSTMGNYGERVLITIFLTPTVMTMYEVLVKLPRFVKASLGFGASAVTPVASELDALDDESRLRLLYQQGLRFNLMLMYPVILCATFFAGDFLRLWVGTDYLHLTTLLQVMLLVYMVVPLGNFGWKILVGRNKRLAFISHLQWVNTIFKLAVVYFLLERIGLWAVVVASASVVITLPVSLKIFGEEIGVGPGWVAWLSLRIALVGASPVILVGGLGRWISLDGLVPLVLAGGVWVVAAWPLFYWTVMDAQSQTLVRDAIGALMRVRSTRRP